MNDTAQRWDVTTEAGMLGFYDVAFEPAHRCAVRLTRGDRAAAEDLVHDAFVRLVRSIRDDGLAEVGVGWIITTLRRRFVDRLRSHEREERRLRLVAQDPAVTDRSGLGVAALLDDLDERQRAALILRYVEDLPVAEVADLLGTSVRATESLLQRAKQSVRANERHDERHDERHRDTKGQENAS